MSDRNLSLTKSYNAELRRQIETLDDEIEDLHEQIEIKRRAPISKKRESDNRLTKALERFEHEWEESLYTLTLLIETMCGYTLLGFDQTPSLTVQVSID